MSGLETMETSEKENLLPPSSSLQSNHCIQEAIVPDEVVPSKIAFRCEMRELPQGKSSAIGAVFIIINAALGAGLLTFPSAFYSAGGVVEGIAVQVLVLFFVITGILILGYTAEVKQAATYEDAVSEVWGPVIRVCVELCVFFYCFGASIAYLAVIGDQITDFTSAFKLAGKWFVDRRFTITVAAFVLIMPWLWLRRIGVLSYISFLAVVSCVYIALVVTIKYFIDGKQQSTTPPPSCEHSWPDIFNAVPFICFAYQCHVSSVPVYAGLKKRNLKVYSVIITAGLAICLFIYTFTGTFGYLTFQDRGCKINSDILRNYPASDIPINVARFMLAIVMVSSYPIPAYCGRTALDSVLLKLFRLCGIAKKVESYPGTRWRVEGMAWLIITLALAIFVPEISYVIHPIGGLAATFIFIFPGLCLLKLTMESRSLSTGQKLLLVLGAFIIATVGTFIFGNSVVYSVFKDAGLIHV